MKKYSLYIFAVLSFLSISCLANNSAKFEDLKKHFKDNPCKIEPRLGCCEYDVYEVVTLLIKDKKISDSKKIKVYRIDQEENILNLKNSPVKLFAFHVFFSYRHNNQEFVFDYLTRSFGELKLEEWLKEECVGPVSDYNLGSWRFDDYVDYIEGSSEDCCCTLL
jgi:hypothetical protein